MHLVFDKANCNGHPETPFSLTLVALIGPFGDPAPSGESGLSEAPPLADVPALTMGAPTGPPGEAPAMLRSVEAASAINEYSVAARMTRKLPTHMLPGQLVDVPHMNLAVGTGVDGASIVWAVNKDARLEARTTLILLPSSQNIEMAGSGALKPAAGRATSSQTADIKAVPSTVAAILPPDIAEQTEICSGACNEMGLRAIRDAAVSTASATIPIGQLGYAPHDKQRALTFNHETALTYLDEHHLLCTFDPHRLRVRAGSDADALRTIRAIMIDPPTHTITKVVEWRVQGDDSYLWRLGQSQVLVHMGHELRLLDEDLRPLKSIPAEGPIAWVVSSPSSDHIAVAVEKDRYSDSVSRDLADMNETPDLDVEVRVYDRNLDLLSASIRSSRTMPPVLSDGGELRATHVSHGHWKIVEYGWDKAEHNLATVRTACRPLLSAPEHDLIFVTGCMGTSGGTWYRMLRSDGHPLLKGESPSDEIDQSAEAAVNGSFAVRVFKAVSPINVDQPFNRSDLTREEIAIYRTSNGAKLASVVTDDFILAQDSYALSPAGDQMAIIGKDSIEFFDLKSQH